MKAILINLVIILLIAVMYYLDFWTLFSYKYTIWYALGMVIIVLLIGLKVIGNPFGKRK